MPKDKRVAFGPCVVPRYPISSFSKLRLPEGVSAFDLWKLVGPTVERNLNSPLWVQYCAIYFEGLNHGAGAMRDSLLDTGEYTEPLQWLP